jgi:hypothetical protein
MRHVFYLVIMAGLMTPILQARAQSSPALHIVIVQGTPKGATAAEVLIRGGSEARNFIIVDKRATADDLAAAVNIVRHIRSTVGDTLTKDIRAVARPSARPSSKSVGPMAEFRAGLGQALDKLDKGRPEDLKDFGKVKYIDFVIGAETRRGGDDR